MITDRQARELEGLLTRLGLLTKEIEANDESTRVEVASPELLLMITDTFGTQATHNFTYPLIDKYQRPTEGVPLKHGAFRVWDKRFNRYENKLVNGKPVLAFVIDQAGQLTGNDRFTEVACGCHDYEVEYWTGCISVDGDPIYEGDKVKIHVDGFVAYDGTVFVPSWKDGFVLVKPDGSYSTMNPTLIDYFIVGNVHDQ